MIESICELEDCEQVIYRYPYQIKEKTNRFCSQSHSSLAIKRTYKKSCQLCNLEFVAKSGAVKYCSQCKNSNPRFTTYIGSIIESTYGITYNDYTKMLKEQQNKCKICNIDFSLRKKAAAVDHDHTTGKVRGLLCVVCNTNLGWYENNKNVVSKYLEG